MTDPVLTTGRLNRALLARQLLLERSSLTIPQALERLAGIQNQYAPNAYVRLWSCLEDFGRDDLTRAYEEGSVVQGTLMRGTIHTVSARDYHSCVAAVRGPRRDWARKIYQDDDADRDALVARVQQAILGRAITRAELLKLRDGASNAAWSTIDTDAELIRVPPSGTWERRRADLFGLADDVLGKHDDVSGADALAHLVRRYLAGFGPASGRDVAEFTGVPVTRLKPVLGSMELRRFRDEAGMELLDVPEAPLPREETHAPVRFLPTWDATLLIHARRTQILPEQYRPLIFTTKMPPSFPTFLVDGQVAGTWRHERGRIELRSFGRLARGTQRELEAEANRLAAFHA